MPGIADIALGAAPIAGGALLASAAGSFRGPDVRALITKDMDLLERIPDSDPELKARLKASIDERIRDLIEANEKSRQLRQIAASYEGNWRDLGVFLSAVLFTFVWWHVSHSRTNWLPTFIAMIIVSVIAGIYALRALRRSLRRLLLRRKGEAQ